MTDKIPKSELREDLVRVKSELGEIPSRRKYNEVGEFSYGPVRDRFGSWNDALMEIFGDVRKHQETSEKELINEIKRLHEDLGRAPKKEDMDNQGKYSSDIYWERFGSWRGVVESCGIDPVTRGLKSGSEHRDWKGGTTDYYHPNWRDIREEIIKRDGKACRVCEESEKRLCVHHIRPRSEYVDDGEYNYESACSSRNLITLCNSCHMKFEGKYIGAPHYNFSKLAKNSLYDENNRLL